MADSSSKYITSYKRLICTYENLSADPLTIYTTLLDKLCSHSGFFKFFVVFSNSTLKTNVFIKMNYWACIISPSKISVSGIVPCIIKPVSKAGCKSLSKIIPANEVKFDFDMEYHAYLKEQGMHAPQVNLVSESKKYFDAKMKRLNFIKCENQKLIKKYQKKLNKFTAIISDLDSREEILQFEITELLKQEKEDQEENSLIIQKNEELRKRILDLEELVFESIPIKRVKTDDITL